MLVLPHHRPRLAAFNFLRHWNPVFANLIDLDVLSEIGLLLIVVQRGVVEPPLLAQLAAVFGSNFV